MSCNETYTVRVTPDPNSTVLIFTVGTPLVPAKVVTSFTNTSGKTLCFREDTQSTVKNLVLGVDECAGCNKPGDWKAPAFPDGLSVTFTSPSGPFLLKAATSGNVTYTAKNNLPTLEGGRPIIRHELNYVVFLAVLAAIAAILAGYFFMRRTGPAGTP